MTLDVDATVPPKKFWKGMAIGFFLSLIFWATLFGLLLVLLRVDQPLPHQTIHVDSVAPDDR